MSKPKFDPNQPFESAESRTAKPKFDPNAGFEIADQKQEKPEEESGLRQLARTSIDTILPVAGAIGGGLLATPSSFGLGTIPGGALGYAAGKQGARILKNQLLGDPYDETDAAGLVKQTVGDVGEGAIAETGGLALGKVVEVGAPMVSKSIKGVGKSLANKAEKLAENATGATRVQKEKFADNAGRELLDRKIVSFGDDAEKIAEKSSTAIKQAEKGMDDALKSLEEQGAKVDVNKVVSNVESKIAELKKDPSKADVVRKLEQVVLDITGAGESSIGLSFAEKIKRGFNKNSRNWLDPMKGEADKTAYLAYRDAVEEAAQAVDPQAAKLFTDSKKTYGLMNPIEDAATKRAAQLEQSPVGGFLDVTSGLVGGGVAGIPGAVGAAVGRRFLSPRISSSMAVTADKASKPLMRLGESIVTPAAQTTSNVVKGAFIKDAGTLKGVDKWIAKGQDRIIETDSSLDREFLDKVKSNKKFKDQLIRAGELSPNSGRMKEVIESIKSSEEYKQFQKEKEKQAQGKEPDQSSVKPIQNEKFPKSIRKGSQTAVVKNVKELYEAISEGWA